MTLRTVHAAALTNKTSEFSPRAIYSNGEEWAEKTFARLRWQDNQGRPLCPSCECRDIVPICSRAILRCAACRKQFSITSGTMFASRKMPYADLLVMISIMASAKKGISSGQLSANVGCQQVSGYKAAMKIRKAMTGQIDGLRLGGDIEIDGAYFGGVQRRPNIAGGRKWFLRRDMEKAAVVIVARERDGLTKTFVANRESEAIAFIPDSVASDSRLIMDGSRNWNRLAALYANLRIHHKEGFSIGEACTNQAESFFSRLRTMVRGQHGHVSREHLRFYAGHAAWLENHRHESADERVRQIITLCMQPAIRPAVENALEIAA